MAYTSNYLHACTSIVYNKERSQSTGKRISTLMLFIKYVTQFISLYPVLLALETIRPTRLSLHNYPGKQLFKRESQGLVICEAVLPSSPLLHPDPNERGEIYTQPTHTMRVQSHSEVTDDCTGTPSGPHTEMAS